MLRLRWVLCARIYCDLGICSGSILSSSTEFRPGCFQCCHLVKWCYSQVQGMLQLSGHRWFQRIPVITMYHVETTFTVNLVGKNLKLDGSNKI